MSLSTLPQELRLKIVDHLTDSCDGHKNKVATVRNLSTTCRSLNSTCGHVIFHSYHLDIRDSFIFRPMHSNPTGTFIYTWNHSAIKARLAHLQSKAPFVRNIYITDDGDAYRTRSTALRNETRPFPPAFIPVLLSTLRMLGPLYTVYIVTHHRWDLPNAMISTELWKWVVEVSPTLLFLMDGHFEFPQIEILQPIENLETLALVSCTNATIKALRDSQKPRQISFAYVSSPDPKQVYTTYYTPTDRNLESIDIYIRIQDRETRFREVFDFSKVPRASMILSVNFLGMHKIYEQAWRMLRPLLQRMFVEDLSGYDVRHVVNEWRVIITRSPEKGWKPIHQDHA